MKPVITRGSLVTCDSEAIILFLFENSPLRGAARTVDERSGGLLSLVLDAGDFRGKLFELNLLYPKGLIGPQRILLTGLGKKEDATLDILRGAASKAAQKIRDLHIGSFALSLDIGIDSFSVARRAEAIIEGTALGLYRFLIFKSEKDEFKDEIETLTIVEEDPSLLGVIGDAAAYAVAIADAVSFTRDLVAAPSNEMTPSVLAERARSVASDTVTVEVLHREAIEFLGMNAFLSVAKGSAEPPTFTIMKYDGGTPGSRPVVLVGKGITFDSGGICLKPAERMDEMKTDMAGAAAVIGTVKAAAALALPVTLIGLIPAAENLPSGHACKPGDIITSLSGKTIEVINTDAEGRLLLADALAYGRRFNPSALIDIATLTGACVIALGESIMGMMSADEDLKQRLRQASENTGEPLWELPLWKDYEENLKSDVADVRNTGATRYGGAITAALFLKKFVGDAPWVHLDIAGPARLSKDRPYTPKGASGIGTRLFIEMLRHWNEPSHGNRS